MNMNIGKSKNNKKSDIESKENAGTNTDKTVWKGGALLSPLPMALVSCGDFEKSNIITIAWTGIVNTLPPKVYISVRPQRHSYELIKKSGEFVINLTDSSMVRGADSCGVFTGAKVDKFSKFSFTKARASKVSCPIIAESPLSLECKVEKIIPLGSHDMFIADVLATDVATRLIDGEGKLHLDRADIVAFSHGEYFRLGKKVGSFGFSVKKKRHDTDRK